MNTPAASGHRPFRSGDFPLEREEWTAAYAGYQARSSERSSHLFALYSRLLADISHASITPQSLHELWTSFARVRGTEYAGRMAAMSAQFFSGLSQLGSAAWSGPIEIIGTPPVFDAAQPLQWFQQLAEYSSRLNENAWRDYQADVDRVASGAAEQTSDQARAAAHDRTARQLRRVTQLCFDLLNGLTDIYADYQEEFLRRALAPPGEPGGSFSAPLELNARLGDNASATIALSNSHPEHTVVHCSATQVRRSDAVGPAFDPRLTITPQTVQLGPGEESDVQVSLQLDPALYEPEAVYVGVLHLARQGGSNVDVPLRIRAAQPATQ